MKWHVNIKAIALVLALTAILTFGHSQTGYAAAVAVSSQGGGVFTIQGLGLDSVGGMDITLTYDSSLANPRFAPGDLISGALAQPNLTVPGKVRLGIIRTTPMQGSGVIGTLTFDRKGSSPGKVAIVAASFAINEKMVPATIQAGTDTSGSSQNQDTSQPAAGGASSAPVLPGVILVPFGGVTQEEKKDQTVASSQTETAPAGDTTAAVKAPGASSAGPSGITASLEPQKKKVQQFMSVLERFQKNRKERTEKAFLSYFDQVEANGFSQEPPVALADGKTTVKVFFVVPASGSTAPDFALRGAKLVSIKKDADRSNTWVLEAQPEKGEYEASLMVSRGDVILEYPLTLAPKINLNDGSRPVTDEDFSRYLSGKRKDLNNDGKRDYLDDYIFTANFIVARQKK